MTSADYRRAAADVPRSAAGRVLRYPARGCEAARYASPDVTARFDRVRPIAVGPACVRAPIALLLLSAERAD